tara:strand:- start:510 stop:1259 length:750 start_codon:yes stop_codon:yes gene_type:complete
MAKKVDQESEEYKIWKGETKPVDEIPKLETKKDEPKKENKGLIHWFFFGDIFSDKSEEGKMRKRYYRIMILFYLLLCFLVVYSLEYQRQSLGEIILLSLGVAMVLPFFLIISVSTPGVNIVVGIFASLILSGLGRLSKFILYILGYDVSIIFPELIGKTGRIIKHNWLGNYSTYPYIAEIENMGMYGRSFIHKNTFAVKSYEQFELGTEIEVTKFDMWSIQAFLRNQPTFDVVELKEKNAIKENYELKE